MVLGDFITKWSIRGIARTQLRLLNLTRKKNPDVSEQEIATLLFTRRMNRVYSSTEQKERVQVYFNVNSPIRSIREACYAIAVVEFKIHPLDDDNVQYLKDIIDNELDKHGYVENRGSDEEGDF